MHCMVSDLLVFSERMGVSHSRRDCFIRSFFAGRQRYHCWLLCESVVLVLRFVAEGWKWTCLGDSGGILSREVMRGTGGLLGLRGIGVSFFMAPFVFFKGLTGVGDVIHFWGGILLVA